jgi:hypothetical protein
MSARFLTALACMALCACASSPDPAREQVASACKTSDPPTGTIIVKRGQCVETTEEQRDQQRRLLEDMQRDQEMRWRRGLGH